MTKSMSNIATWVPVVAFGLVALVGCGAEPPREDGTPRGSVVREFDYVNQDKQKLNCIIINEGYNSAVMSCVEAPIATPTPN